MSEKGRVREEVELRERRKEAGKGEEVRWN
jgi:hypothetical protein